MRRAFLELDGSPEREAELERWRSATVADLGPARSTYRLEAVHPAIAALVVGVGLLLLVPGLVLSVAAIAGALPLTGLVVGALLVLLVLAVEAGVALVARTQAWRRDITVHQHGLLVGGRVVPFATMDPGRMYWADGTDVVGRVVTASRRRLVVRGDVLLLCGTDGWTGDEDGRGGPTLYDHSPDVPWVPTPFVWWCLGPRDVAGLVRDLERALLADGYPVAGLADRLAVGRGMPPGRGEAFPRRERQAPLLHRV